MARSQNAENLSLGLDIGSTTAKIVLRRGTQVLLEKYERHFSQVREKTVELLCQAAQITGSEPVYLAISGSAGLGLAEAANLPFVQEVFATGEMVRRFEADTSCVIELGGEDAKIIFFDGGLDERMNGSCAGGTGAFIDQMATLLDVTVDELDALSLKSERLYPIASRCGVFAKSDIQPLLNQGARKEDIAASIYQAVVNQTIAGLAQGRRIEGTVMFLGGPLYFCKGLQRQFKRTLNLSDEQIRFPEYGRLAVAIGASLYAENSDETFCLTDVVQRIKGAVSSANPNTRLPRLFENEEEYEAFQTRHAAAAVPSTPIASYCGNAFLGIDCGSTTTKLALIAEDKSLLYTYYASNRGNPVQIVREQLQQIYALCEGRIRICGSAVTGYGEELIRHAFRVDHGLVETIAHYTAAKHFRPDVDFILDIGGQDIKCFQIRGGAIDSIMLNEACSSGCGSFLETFERSLGYGLEEFARLGVLADSPVNLGSRCTVFMNSSVKQSQKEGATVADISAGLAISVVKNALYKVIRAASARDLGEHIVVQGGTFWNDCVLRAFEMELGAPVIRPNIAGLMGAYGAALYSMKTEKTTLLTPQRLQSFIHTAKSATCKGCQNNCRLTINSFADGERFVSGNQCEKGAGTGEKAGTLPNLYEFKRNYLSALPQVQGARGTIGFPLALGMYELLPLWHGIFTNLGFGVVISPISTRRLYEKGQFSIPSDTACYPAKIMHGHIAWLLEQNVDAVFYPCLTYNVDEAGTDNHYNCPVVAYYSELLKGNMEQLQNTRFLHPYLNINKPKELVKELTQYLNEQFGGFSKKEVAAAVACGFAAYEDYCSAVRAEGERAVAWARESGKRIMVLSGRPYHIDSEICHGIDKLAVSLGFTVVSEDSICQLAKMPEPIRVLNQWTYHARLYRAAQYALEHDDTQLVQLVSFGCGVDAITTDEVRRILEDGGKLYTQLKIDEITNLGAVKIRLRSLLGALEEKEERHGK